MQDLRDVARTLLDGGEVGVVIGWEEARRGVRPVFITEAADADKLVFDTRCVHNLATYLNPRRDHLRKLGRIGVVVKGCDTKAVAGILREAQIDRDQVVLIGVRCGGVTDDHEAAQPAELTAENVAPRCFGCDVREPALVDHLVGEAQPEPPRPTKTLDERVAEIEALPFEERWAYWTAQFNKCIRCYACREVCPLCMCETCIADKTRPQWIEQPAHGRSNLSWNITRALHLAGRCVECGECERFCPVGIPLSVANHKVAQIMKDRFGHTVSDDPDQLAPIGAYRLDDQQEFIK